MHVIPVTSLCYSCLHKDLKTLSIGKVERHEKLFHLLYYSYYLFVNLKLISQIELLIEIYISNFSIVHLFSKNFLQIQAFVSSNMNKEYMLKNIHCQVSIPLKDWHKTIDNKRVCLIVFIHNTLAKAPKSLQRH